MAEIMRSFDVCLFVGLCVCAVDRWELNANNSKTIEAADFKFGTSVPRDSLDMTSEKEFFQKGPWSGSRDP